MVSSVSEKLHKALSLLSTLQSTIPDMESDYNSEFLNNYTLHRWDCLNNVLLESLKHFNNKNLHDLLLAREIESSFMRFVEKLHEGYILSRAYFTKLYALKDMFTDCPKTPLSSLKKYEVINKQRTPGVLFKELQIRLGNDAEDESLNHLRKKKSCSTIEHMESITYLLEYTEDIHKYLMNFTKTVLSQMDIGNECFINIVNSRLKNYCINNKSDTLRKLKIKAQEFKENRHETLSPSHWGKTLDYVYDSIKSDYKDAHGSFFYTLLHGFFDDEIFDLNYAREEDIYGMLNISNYYKFFDLVLRHDLIVCEMHPDLKPQFEAWLNDEEPAEPSVSEPEDKGPLFTPQAMVLWGKLQKAGLMDKKLQPKVSMRKASMIAKIMGDILGLNPLWQPFEELWNAKNLSKAYYFASVSEYKDSFPEEINKALNIS